MKELISLETPSNIDGAASSGAIEQLFETIQKVEVEDLRDDVIVEVSDAEKRLIIDSFPNEKNNYLVVPKVIEE